MAEKYGKTSEDIVILPPVGGKKKKKTAGEKSEKKVGRPLKIKTPKDLERAVNKYFSSISALEPVRDITGAVRLDEDGDIIERRIYFSPPDVLSLCLFLGIDERTWENYSSEEKHPEFHDITVRTKMRMEAYLREVLVTREKGSLQGVIFNLQNNYGWREKKEVELGKETRDAVTDMSLSDKLALIADLKSGKLDIPADIPDEEDDEEE